MQIGIIGAGIAGLATAVRQAARGHNVTVFEANNYPGGKLSSFGLQGYRFDAGPSLFTMPQYVDELFLLAGEQPEDHFRYSAQPVACHYFWDDGVFLPAWADPARLAGEIETRLAVPAERVGAFLAQSARKYETAGRIFLEKSLHRADTWLRLPVFQALLRLPGFDLFSSMHQVHERWFAQQPKLVQLFDRYATYNGSDPFKAPGMLTIIPHFEFNIGVFYPEGGMYAITSALFELAKRLGVTFHFNQPVSRILTRNNKIAGLEAGGEKFDFDAVVSNMDIYYTYSRLLTDQPRPQRILNQPKSTSALIFYWGVKRSFPELELHNIFFSSDYAAEFAALARGEVCDDPTVYLNITSKRTPADAPEGCENWFILVNAPADNGQQWSDVIEIVRKHVVDKLSARLGIDIEPLIETEDILHPQLIESRTSSHRGALYGYSSNNRMAAFLRHPNFSRRIQGLYFVGGSVHPGGGIPLCLLSARITDAEIQRAFF